ncbi:MAG: hypothetical protein NTY48_06610 [Candidatus Diapherotrites archaeon]|nr:hypothetical protein [Candidatus Diapherotrites archaeon]
MKGFLGIILMFAAVMTGIMILGATTTMQMENPQKENITKMKSHYLSYEATLKQMTKGCNWTSVPVTCVDNNSNLLLTEYNAQKTITCAKYPGGNYIDAVAYDLNCTIKTTRGKNIPLTITTSKKIIIKNENK